MTRTTDLKKEQRAVKGTQNGQPFFKGRDGHSTAPAREAASSFFSPAKEADEKEQIQRKPEVANGPQQGPAQAAAMSGPPTVTRNAAILSNFELLQERQSVKDTMAKEGEEAAKWAGYLQSLDGEVNRRAGQGHRWLQDDAVANSSQQLYQVFLNKDLLSIAEVNADRLLLDNGGIQLGSSTVVTQKQLNTAVGGFQALPLGGVAAAAGVPGLNIRLIPPEMLTLYHGTTTKGEASIKSSGVNVAHSPGQGQDFGQGFYVSEDSAVGTEYKDSRGGGSDGKRMQFRVPKESFGVVVDIRPGGPHAEAFQKFLTLSAHEALGLPELPSMSMTVREFYKNPAASDIRGTLFDNFLRRINMSHADVIIGPLGGDSPFSGVAPENGSTQMSIRSAKAAELLNRSMQGDNFGEMARPGVPSVSKGAAAGAVAGGLIAVVIQGGVILIDSEQHPGWQSELAKAGVLGTGSGALGGAADAAIANRMISGGSSVLMGRVVGGGVAGGVAAPVFEIGRMAMDDNPHTATDYAAKGTRAATSGAVSGAISAGIVGAIWGSEVPILGNIVGFGIGVGVYMLSDYLMGDTVEQTVRDVAD